ncbi:MAG: HNH endonuclease [Chitinophagaceae bacterium]|nr:HNH endonuclease [Chitinophagaceae bacterium]
MNNNNMFAFDKEIEMMKVNKIGNVISLHKPLLLLLTISEIIHGHKNEFLYDDLESPLSLLISKYGLKNTSKLNPQYPFIYLASSPKLWDCSISKFDLKHPDAASRKELLGAIGYFTNEFYTFIKSRENALHFLQQILNQYWPEVYHIEILQDLGIYELNQNVITLKSERSRKFAEEVLDAYERKCAICNQSIRLGDALVGIDCCHVKPIQHFGADNINNGIALCKIHHWALDRGAISISQEMSLLVSKKLNGNKLFEFFTSFENVSLFVPRAADSALGLKNIEYHANYIFVK